MSDFSNYWNALSYAIIHYGENKRFSGVPYIIHPIRVAAILRAAGFSQKDHEELLIAAIFHDLVEDTETTLDEIRDLFGNKVASIVDEVSKPKKKNKDEWLKEFSNHSEEAKVLKMADRIDNLMDMKAWSIEKQKTYANQGKIIIEKCSSSNNFLAKKLNDLIQIILEKAKSIKT